MANIDIEREKKKQRLRDNIIEGTVSDGEGVRKPSLAMFLTVIICVILFGFGIYYYVEHNITYEYTVDWASDIEEISSTSSNQISFVAFDGGLVTYSRDGAEFTDQDGQTIWERSYQMTTPIVDTSDGYIVIADQGYTRLYIFNSAGLLGETDTLQPISKIAISDGGIVYAVLNDADADYITAYRSDGSTIDLSVKSVISGDGYPFDIDVSPDGTELVTSYVTIENEQVVNNVVFRNFGEVGANESASRVVGGFQDEFEGHLAGSVHFSTNEYSQAFYDGGIVFFSTRVLNSPEVLSNISFEENVLSVQYNERLVAVLLEGTGEENTLRIFSIEGKSLAWLQLESDLKNLAVSGNRVIVYSDDHILIYGRNGNLHGDIQVDSSDVNEIKQSGTNRAFYIIRSGTVERATI